MNLICKTIHGSRLYGTATVESDTDYKGIYLPDFSDVILKKDKKTINQGTSQNGEKNTKDDIDCTIFSLQYWMELAKKGETNVFDMLHAPDSCIVETTPLWEYIRQNRTKFYSKNLKAFVGYCKSQASKYGVRAGRYEDLIYVLDVLLCYRGGVLNGSDTPISEFWDLLPETNYAEKMYEPKSATNIYKVLNRKFEENVSCGYLLKQLIKIEKSYGQRVKNAANMGSADWKSISHAFRVALQMKEILTTGDLKFPLKDAKFLADIKLGKLDMKKDGLSEQLDDLVIEIERLNEESKFPEKCDEEFWDDFLVEIYEKKGLDDHYKRNYGMGLGLN
jgi:predicted nucleotidyltransferase